MKIFLVIIISIIAQIAFNIMEARADPIVTCGMPPNNPYNCQEGKPICSCLADGQCFWLFVGC